MRRTACILAAAVASALAAPAAASAASGAAAHGSSGHVSTAAIVAAVVAGLVALACLAWALARVLAYEPRWWLDARHALAEASFRVSSTWEEFGDWVRSGR